MKVRVEMKKIALLIMALTMLSKVFGFGREITLSYLYGATGISDAYLIAITIPSVIFGFAAAGIAAGYIPMYSKIIKNEGEIEANRFTNNLINILMVICTLIILMGLVFTEQLVKMLAYGFEGKTLDLAVRFTKISLMAIYFTGIVTIVSGYLQIKKDYIIPALIGLPFNLLVILSIVLSTKTNNSILALGFVISVASQMILMIPSLRKNKYHYKLVFDVKDKHIINMAYIALPIILGVSVNQINVLVDRTIASQIAVGGISVMNYAYRLNGFVQGMFVSSIATVVYPMISKMAAEKNMDGLKSSLSEAITGINLLVIPATVGAMVFAVPIVSILFGRGAFDSQAVSMTAHALFFYAIGMAGMGLREIVSRAFYAMQDTKTPMINALIGTVLNVVLNIILAYYMGIGGLALATSITALFTTAVLFYSLRNKIGPFGMKQITISFLKILFASLVMGGAAKCTFKCLTYRMSPNLMLIAAIGVGAIIYFALIYFMKIEDIDVIVNGIKRKLGQRSTV